MLKVIKEYPARGPLQQFRLERAAAFTCFRCGTTKTAKLRSVYAGDQSRLLCNGCYGRLLSIFDVKASGLGDDEKADRLAQLLVGLASEDDARRAVRRLQVARASVDHLVPAAVRLLGTAEYVAASLDGRPNLDWSAAVIGLCKAVEVEAGARLVEPLKRGASGIDLSVDVKDKDLGRVASYCAGRADKPPEMGAMRHFLQTAVNSEQRATTSPILGVLRALVARWPGASWILSPSGFLGGLAELTTRFRNPAAHVDELARADFVACRELVAGPRGLLWELALATQA
ncbi:MAG: hypothetical protein IT379_02310 [Deltaproteobacteria bacterium]|nr:hypothetical protein [Deltaproteobacteria bacterium]